MRNFLIRWGLILALVFWVTGLIVSDLYGWGVGVVGNVGWLLASPRCYDRGLIGMWVPRFAEKPQGGTSRREAKKLRLQLGQLVVESTFFMPYSLCPKCNTEGLHWIREPKNKVEHFTSKELQIAAGLTGDYNWLRMPSHRDFVKSSWYYSSNDPEGDVRLKMDEARYQGFLKDWTDEMGRVGLSQLTEGDFDVMRTCCNHDCNHTWGQNVGTLLSTEVA